MANEIVPEVKPAAPAAYPAAHNAQIAQQVKSQDIMGQSTATGEFGEATDALDKLAAQVKPAEAVPAPKPDVAPAAKPAAPAPDAAEIAQAAENEKHLKRAGELFKDSPALPPNASPKSAEAFSSIKIRAAQEISARDQKIEEMVKQIEDAKKPAPEQLQREKELEEHRQWRLKMDVDFDPKFKEFDKSIGQQREFIYAQLAKSPAVTPEVIEQIKKIGGPDKVNLSKLFEAIKDPTLQRLVESKVADIEMAKYNKEQAVTAAKGNLSKYLEERQQQLAQETSAARHTTVSSLEGMLGKLDWFSERKLEASADETAKKEAEEHNKFLTDLKGQLSAAVQDETPEMRAILLTGMAQLFHLQRRVPALEARAAAAEKELGEVKVKWDAVRNSSRSRLQESQAPAGGIPAQKTGTNFNERASDALDNIARQVMEQRSQQASGNA
jgi:hypothetical protein